MEKNYYLKSPKAIEILLEKIDDLKKENEQLKAELKEYSNQVLRLK